MKLSKLQFAVVFMVFTLILAACSGGGSSADATPTPTALEFVLPTLAPTETPRPTATPVPPTTVPTVAPVEGTTTTQINVRNAPDKAAAALGMLQPGDKIKIIGKDPTEKWWMIYYPLDAASTGWVSAEFVTVTDTAGIPVIGGSPEATGTPEIILPEGVTAKTTQKINVRSGPGVSYNSLGLTGEGEDVIVTGKNETGTWLQIYFPSGPGERGWITVAYVQVGDVSGVPVLNDEGTPMAEPSTDGTPDAPVPTPTLVIAAAHDDGDSAQAPAVSVSFSPDSARQFAYTSDVSSPQGDGEDWVQFAPYTIQPGQTAPLIARLQCSGNGTLKVELWENGKALSGWGTLACGGAETRLTLAADAVYFLHIIATDASDLQYTLYTLTVKIGQ